MATAPSDSASCWVKVPSRCCSGSTLPLLETQDVVALCVRHQLLLGELQPALKTAQLLLEVLLRFHSRDLPHLKVLLGVLFGEQVHDLRGHFRTRCTIAQLKQFALLDLPDRESLRQHRAFLADRLVLVRRQPARHACSEAWTSENLLLRPHVVVGVRPTAGGTVGGIAVRHHLHWRRVHLHQRPRPVKRAWSGTWQWPLE